MSTIQSSFVGFTFWYKLPNSAHVQDCMYELAHSSCLADYSVKGNMHCVCEGVRGWRGGGGRGTVHLLDYQ